ncbi:MAG: very short patch repair endonuclease [Pseudomonadota bacterium]|uniref:very short patch repair endonuclease n=1 Tax=Sinimarinibacterium flocculans TaxID=985250 RepID=UPI0024934CD0|nr:very short patch repair endonuclease [Sinimarinibacterium flocculans]MEC9363075.1 very short patch repair endonuclease [Pseudomonadota bacterium]
MADVLTEKQRSYCMSRIRGRDTGPELTLRRAVWAEGLRYRVRNRLKGRPDIVFASARVAVFVDGCFWHGCPAHSVKPKTRAAFWAEKIDRNKARDTEIRTVLRREGWTVLRFWEHEIEGALLRVVARVRATVEKGMARNQP